MHNFCAHCLSVTVTCVISRKDFPEIYVYIHICISEFSNQINLHALWCILPYKHIRFSYVALTLGVSAKYKLPLPIREYTRTYISVCVRACTHIWPKGGRRALGHGRRKIKGKITGLWPGWAKSVASGVATNGTQDDVERLPSSRQLLSISSS